MNQKEEYIINFLKQTLLGQSINMNDPEVLLTKIIKLADKDMLSGGRFITYMFEIDKQEERANTVKTILEEDGFSFNRESIKKIAEKCFWKFDQPQKVEITIKKKNKTDEEKTVKKYDRIYNSFGLAQKLYNMTFKYLYIYKDFLPQIKNVDFSKCDCPIDSVILGSIDEIDKDLKWTSLDSSKYIKIQNIINKKLDSSSLKDEIGRLAFDDKWLKTD